MFNSTPLQKLQNLDTLPNIDIFCKRDDLYPSLYGGNKARIVDSIFLKINNLQELKDGFIISAGNINSNFNRVLALKCAELGLKLKLFIYRDEDQPLTINYDIVKSTNTEIINTNKSMISISIDNCINYLLQHNIPYKYIYGGGSNSIDAYSAYFDVVKEMDNQIGKLDHVFVACGTGTTTSGLIYGLSNFFPNTMLHAISISRSRKDQLPIIEKNINSLKIKCSNLRFYDDYIAGGYGKSNNEIQETIQFAIKNYGMVLDETYSGKAFWAMIKIIKSNINYFKHKNIVFINTSGLFNYLDRYKSWK